MSYYIRGLTVLSRTVRPSFCGVSSLQQSRSVVLKPIQVKAANETYEEKNEKLGRPMSPHVTIYKMQFQSYLSIFHRITGVISYSYVYFLAAGTFLPISYPELINTLQHAHYSPVLIVAAKFLLAFPFSYHISTGIRHLIWDYTAKFLTIPAVFRTGYAVIGLAVALTTGLLML